jgi:serpin B
VTLILTAAAISIVACDGAGDGEGRGSEARSEKVRIVAPVVPEGDLKTLAADNDRFAWDLYQAVGSTSDNLVFSPASISIALAMTFGGARGTTADQMVTTMHFSLPPERLHPAFNTLDLALASRGAGTPAGAFRLSLANAVWSQRDFVVLPAYLDLLAENYGAGVRLTDFVGAPETARLTINRWVSDETQTKIPELLPSGSVDSLTRLVLTNAVYFRADWETPFSAQSPDGVFQTPTGPVTVPMMRGPEAIALWSGPGFHAAALPYKGGGVSMVLIVPDPGTFATFEATLTADALDAIIATAPSGLGSLFMPRFKLKTDLDLGKILTSMGMSDAFGPAADFSGIDGGRDLFIKAALHQATIAVDEKGTEAAAATAVVLGRKSAAAEHLVVDRPFLFVVRDDATGSILFLGRVLNPTSCYPIPCPSARPWNSSTCSCVGA